MPERLTNTAGFSYNESCRLILTGWAGKEGIAVAWRRGVPSFLVLDLRECFFHLIQIEQNPLAEEFGFGYAQHAARLLDSAEGIGVESGFDDGVLGVGSDGRAASCF